jgi:hypothetical protein
MNCPACGHPNRAGNRFCTECGAKLDASARHRGRLIVISEPGSSPRQRRRGKNAPIDAERRSGVEIAQSTFLIGRQGDNTFVINDDQASAYHARIVSDGQHFHIEDLASTNGTYVNGVRVVAPTLLKSECLIKIGGTIVKFEYLPLDADK